MAFKQRCINTGIKFHCSEFNCWTWRRTCYQQCVFRCQWNSA